MGVLEALAQAFIQTFGITQPSERQRRRAAWFIVTMLVAVAVGLIAGGVLLGLAIRR